MSGKVREEMTIRKADIWVGTLIAILGAVTVFASLKIQAGAGGLLHPRTFPLVIGVLLIFMGLIMTLLAGRSMNSGNRQVSWPGRLGARFLVVTCLSMVFYIGSLELIGMPLGSLLFVTFMVWYLGAYGLIRSLVVGVITATLIYLFILGLSVPLPLGPLPM